MTAAGGLDLDAIRARCEAATPGEWKIEEHPEYGIRVGTKDEATWVAWTGDYEDKEFSRPDAVFIAHAPEDISALLAEVQRLRIERDALLVEIEHERTRGDHLWAERDVLAAALDEDRHEYVPWINPSGFEACGIEFGAGSSEYCYDPKDDPVHRTSRVVLAGLDGER